MKSKSYQEQMGRGKGKEKGMEKDQASKKKKSNFWPVRMLQSETLYILVPNPQ